MISCLALRERQALRFQISFCKKKEKALEKGPFLGVFRLRKWLLVKKLPYFFFAGAFFAAGFFAAAFFAAIVTSWLFSLPAALGRFSKIRFSRLS
jgi:hypothetical protein